MMRDIRARRMAKVLAIVASVTFLLAGCTSTVQEPRSPASSVDALLLLRQERSTDASAYAQYVAAPETAAELARSSAEETVGAAPTPAWEPPYVSAQSESTATVIVVWKSREAYPGFPVATEWSLERIDGRWRATDARAIEETAGIPPRAP